MFIGILILLTCAVLYCLIGNIIFVLGEATSGSSDDYDSDRTMRNQEARITCMLLWPLVVLLLIFISISNAFSWFFSRLKWEAFERVIYNAVIKIRKNRS